MGGEGKCREGQGRGGIPTCREGRGGEDVPGSADTGLIILLATFAQPPAARS